MTCDPHSAFVGVTEGDPVAVSVVSRLITHPEAEARSKAQAPRQVVLLKPCILIHMSVAGACRQLTCYQRSFQKVRWAAQEFSCCF